jgi:single-strand DNA-binding protein
MAGFIEPELRTVRDRRRCRCRIMPKTEAFMNSLNNILIEGNLVRDPLLRSTTRGTPICTFRLASNRYYKQDTGFEKETCFFNVETWAKLAEYCYNTGRKGQGIRITGRLKQDRWKGQDGKAHSRVTIVAEHVSFKPYFSRNAAVSGKPGVFSGNTERLFKQDNPPEPDYTEVREARETEAVVF